MPWFPERLKSLLLGGVTPEKIALSIALGLALGVFPALGWTTLLCAAAAAALRLNLPAIQLVNYLAYPLQLALLIPFIRMGEWLFGSAPLALTLEQIAELVRADLLLAISKLLWATLRAIAAWLLVSPFVAAAIYGMLLPVLRRARRTM